MQEVRSTSIQAIGYDGRRRLLLVRFRASGETYAYFGVAPAIFAELEQATSKGRFVNASIKGHYRYERVAQGSDKRLIRRPSAMARLRDRAPSPRRKK